MASYVSPELVRAMGIADTPAPERLIARFSGFTVYELRGVTFPDGVSRLVDGTAAGVNYRVGLSSSVNSACRAISNDDFADDEAKWREEHRTSGPFAVVQVGPTEAFDVEVTRLRREPNGSVITYDAFPDARAQVREFEQRALPRVSAALTCSLNQQDRFVTLKKIARTTAGELNGGATLHDVRLEFKGEGFVSFAMDADSLQLRLDAAASLARSLNDRVAKFIALGQGEEDQMKRFLYFFLALEIETHAAFGRLNHASGTTALLTDAATESPARLLLTAQVSELKGLYDRFVWCAACEWRHLKAEDVALFKQLKQARDSIAHGTTSEPPAGYARLAEQLAVRVLSAA